MKKVEEKLKSFFDEGKLETRKETEKYDDGNVSAWIKYHDVLEFAQIFESSLLDDEGIESNMRDDTLWINFSSVLEHYGIDEEYFI